MMSAITIFLLLFNIQCKAEDACNVNVEVKNFSDSTIVFAIIVPSSTGTCRFDGQNISAGESFNYRPFNSCIEKSIGNAVLEIYLIQSASFNQQSSNSFNCDSIDNQYEILAKYELGLKELEEIDFTIVYF